MDDGRNRKTVDLDFPIEVDGNVVHKLTIVEPSPEEFEAMDGAKGEVGKANRLLAACAAIPLSSVRRMRMKDWNRCNEALAELQKEAGVDFSEPGDPPE